jgi:HSP20 family protein
MRLHIRYVAYGAGPTVTDQMQRMHQLMHQMMARAAPTPAGAWQPPTDVYESDDAIVVQTELAGVKEEDIEITLFADRLSISGVRLSRVPPGTAAYHLAGILYGEFRVEAPVLASVARDDVQASYEDGLLTVVLPKASRITEPTPVRIGQGAQPGRSEEAEAAVPQGVTDGN